MKSKTIDILTLGLITTSIVLMFLPHGVTLKFASINEQNEKVYHYNTFAYFSMLPFGYAVFTPLLTGLTTSLLFILSGVKIVFNQYINRKIVLIISVVALIFSILSISLNKNLFTSISVIISMILIAVTILTTIQYIGSKKQNNIKEQT